MGDHADHLHIGYRPAGGKGGVPVLKRDQWYKLVDKLGEIDNPAVSRRPSKFALPARRGDRPSGAHAGE